MGLFDFFRKAPPPNRRPPPAEPPPTPPSASSPDTPLPRHELRYVFQHQTLCQAALGNDPMLLKELRTPGSINLTLIRARAMSRCMQAGFFSFDDTDGEQVIRIMRVFEPMTLEILRRSGYTAYLITMPPPEECPEVHFVAIVYKDDEEKVPRRPAPSTRYFTLEMMVEPGAACLCEWDCQGAHKNLGTQLPPAPIIFLDAVFQRVLG